MFNPILRSGRGAQIVSDLRFTRFVVSDALNFNTVDHSVLFKKIQYYGFEESVIRWFKPYLMDRGEQLLIILSNNV